MVGGRASPELLRRLWDGFREVWPGARVVRRPHGLIGVHTWSERMALHDLPGKGVVALDGAWPLPVATLAREAGSRIGEPLVTWNGSWAAATPELSGNAAMVDAAGRWSLVTEWSGTFPLYVYRAPERFLFSSHLRVLARALGAEPDPVSVTEFLAHGYVSIGRSLFRGIARVGPGQVMSYDPQRDRLHLRETSRAWVGESLEGDNVERVWERLCHVCRRALENAEHPTLMMSAGWDSRTLLASLRTDHSDDLHLFTHGRAESREVGIARNIADAVDLPHTIASLDGSPYEPDWLAQRFARTESVVYPYWHRAGEAVSGRSGATVLAGVYGEVMGGHYGPTMVSGGLAKVLLVGATLAGANRFLEAHLSLTEGEARDLLVGRAPPRPRAVTRVWWHDEGTTPARLRGRIEADLDRLRRRGVSGGTAQVEAYVSEHRGSQLINSQLLSCRSSVDVAAPYTDQELLRLVSVIPMAHRIHNRLNRAVLAARSPGLLSFPLGATLAQARRPLLVQEATRLLRRTVELETWRLHFLTRGRVPRPSFGWADVEFAREGRQLDRLVADLRQPWWDRDALQERLEQLHSPDWKRGWREMAWIHSDAILRVYTVDLMFR